MTRRTIFREIACEGIALHAGRNVQARLAPGAPCSGVVFRREDLGGIGIEARYDRVTETRLGTVITQGEASVHVIEHLMAAISGAELDDLAVALDGPELPFLAGDALSWLDLIDEAGIREQEGERETVVVRREVQVARGSASAALVPSDRLEFDMEIDFDFSVIGAQSLSWRFSRQGFRGDIAPARTFGFVHELDQLRAGGWARGASLDNTLAIDGGQLLNPQLRRFPDEFVRHKILDCLGDLALSPARVIGRFVGRRSGHALNNALLRALLVDPVNYERIALT